MSASTVRLLVWNIGWLRRKSPRGCSLRQILDEHFCITEGRTDFLDPAYTITSDAEYGYPLKPGRRKVLLWSRNPWNNVDTFRV
jgi:hypothetical protein